MRIRWFIPDAEPQHKHHLCDSRFSIGSKALFAAMIGAAILLPAASAQTLVTSDSALNTGAAASTSYNAPGTGGTNTPVHLATNSSKNLWLIYNNPWGINSGSGTMTQTYSGSGSLTTAINLTGLPGGGVDAYPFVLYGCDPWMDCYQDQPPQFPKQLSAMSSLMTDIKYAMTGTITGSDIDLLFDEWVCNSSSPSDSSQCLEIEVLPYYSFVDFGGGTFIKTINEPVTLNGTSTTFSFDEYVGGTNVLFYPHSMPGLASGELKFNLLDLLNAGVSAFGNSSYKYVAGIELGTEFGASSTQSYTLTLNKIEIDQSSGTQPAGSGLLGPNRYIDWTGAGAGTIPARIGICQTLGVAGQAPTYAQSVTAANIVSALNACAGSNQAVYLNPGTYTMTTTVYGPGSGGATPSNVTLRGAGANQTILKWTSGSNTCIGINHNVGFCVYNGDSGALQYSQNVLNWTGGYAQGTTTITLGSAVTGSLSNLHVGSLIALNQLDTATDNGQWWPCGTSGANGDCAQQGTANAWPGRGQMQIVTVTGISGSNVTISPGLYAPNWSGSKTPYATFSSTLPVTGFGIENLQINTQSAGVIEGMVEMMWTTNSWIKGVAFINNVVTGSSAGKHAELASVAHVTVRDSYLYGSGPASDGYGVDMLWGTSDSLSENNICQHMATCNIAETATGDVFGYTYDVDNFYVNGDGAWQQCDASHHDNGDNYILWEGQEGICAAFDNIHGTAFGLTLFRDYFNGHDPATLCPGGGTSCGTLPKTQDTMAVQVLAANRYVNAFLNVLGTSTYHNTYKVVPSSTTDCNSNPWTTIYSLGYSDQNQIAFSMACGTGGFTVYNDPLVPSTMTFWGNYDTVHAAVQTNSGETASGASTYPGLSSPSTAWSSYPSLYLSGTPSWWTFPSGSTAPFPPVGPDVTGGNISGVGGHVYLNPAANCYKNVMGGLTDGSSGPLNFNASTCYPSGTPALSPPTFSPAGGSFLVLPTVTITLPSGATGCYTTDGTTPAAATPGTCSHGATYSTPVPITVSGTVLKAIATKSGSVNSTETDATYAQTAIQLDAHASNGTNSVVSSITCGPFTPTAGDGITVELTFGTSNTPTVSSISDNVNSGQYPSAIVPHWNASAFSNIAMYYKSTVAGSATTVTVNFSSPAQYVGIACESWKPSTAGSFLLDTAFIQQQDGTTANPTTGSAKTPSLANELVLGNLLTSTSTPTAGTNFTLVDSVPGGPNVFPQYWIQSTATSTNAPYVMGSDAWTDQMAAFFFSSATPTTPTITGTVSITGTGSVH